MRTPRIKLPPAESAAVYHCMSRTVNGEALFDDGSKEVLRRQLWLLASYCGLNLITYAILINHFHVLVEVPQTTAISDQELLRRYQLLHPDLTPAQAKRLERIKSALATDGPEAETWRRRQRALMGDISPFMKLLKQRFSIWFNRNHRRFGTLWAERFKSVLVQNDGRTLETMAAYIDLNAVRAGLCSDPKDYRFCGYAEAVAGNLAARRGLAAVFGENSWEKTQAVYRQKLFGVGSAPRENCAAITRENLERVMAQGGRLPLHEALRCRIRYFTMGAVLGSPAFVADHLATFRVRTGRSSLAAPHPLPALTDWGELATLYRPRSPAFG